MRVALYLRVSTEEQAKGHSLDSQRDLLTDWAEREGWTPAAVYEDPGASGTDATRRPGFQRMVEAAARHEFDVVLVKNRSRYARNLADSAAYDALLTKRGVRVWSLDEPASNDATPAGFLMKGMADLLAAHYSVNLSFSVAQGVRKRAEKGLHTGKPPFGYERPDVRGPLVPHPTEAGAVRWLFERYAGGTATMDELGRSLAAQGFRTKRGAAAFGPMTVHFMLSNQTYLGHVTYHGEVVVPNTHEPLVSQKLFDEVQRTAKGRSQNKTRTRHRGYEFLLSGLAVCSECGSKLWAKYTNNKYAYYVCSARERGFHCIAGSTMAPAAPLEQLVEHLAKELRILGLSERRATQPRPVQTNERELLERRQKRIVKMLADELIPYDEGAAELREIKARLEALKPPSDIAAVQANLDWLRTEWDTADVRTRRARLLTVFSAAVIDVRARELVKLDPAPALIALLTVSVGYN